ncbi:MAG: ATP-binding protein [Chitinivorax sp.]
MKLKTLANWFALLVIGALVANLLAVAFLIHANGRIAAAHARREQAVALTHQLRLETDRLARLVRAYTTTADPLYLLYYYDILAVRAGEKPLPPLASASLYWDEVIAGNRPHKLPLDGPRMSLAERLRAVGGSARELAALQQVLRISEDMNDRAQIAFAATQGLYDKNRGEYVSDGEPDLKFATAVVHGKQYSQLEAQLSHAVVQLIAAVDERTRSSIDEARSAIQFGQWVLAATAVFGFILIARALYLIRTQVLKPISALEKDAKRLAAGDYSARLADMGGVDELLTLERTFDSMAQAIEDDIRSREQMLAELDAARRQAEGATEAKSFFLASMSHEIRTPLNGVIGMLRFALRDQQLASETRHKVRLALSSGESLLTIINDVLDFSKIEAGKLNIESVDFEFLPMLFDGLETLSELASTKGLDFIVEADPLLPRYFRGDPTRIRQVLVNLAGNAIKFTDSGKVTVTVHGEGCDAQSCRLRFKVSDTGIGIAADALPKLFQRFQQADASTTRKFGGTGLGLVICRQLVEAMGGQIQVSSQLGAGTTFEFVLALPLGVAPPQQEQRQSDRNSHQLQVLVAEDVKTNQLIIETLLEEMGHRVEIVDNGLEAVKAVARGGFDVVLMDGNMPVMDGLEATRLIRAGGDAGLPVADRTIGIVALTANVTDAHEQTFRAAGMDAFLTKPIEQQALHAALQQVIDARLRQGADLPPLQPPVAEALPMQPDARQKLRAAVRQSLPDKLQQLERLAGQRQAAALRPLLHGLRASAGFLGAAPLQQSLQQMEAALASEDWDALDAGAQQARQMLQNGI